MSLHAASALIALVAGLSGAAAQFVPYEGSYGLNPYAPQMSPCALTCEAETVKQIPCLQAPAAALTPPTPQYEFALALECGCANQQTIGGLFARCLADHACPDVDQLQQQFELRYSAQICTTWLAEIRPTIPRLPGGGFVPGGVPPGLGPAVMQRFPPPLGGTGYLPPGGFIPGGPAGPGGVIPPPNGIPPGGIRRYNGAESAFAFSKAFLCAPLAVGLVFLL